MIQIGKAVYQILSNDTKVKEMVGNNIYPLIANQGTTYPFIIYRRTGIEPVASKDRFICSEVTSVDVIIASDRYDESIELAELVKDALSGKNGIYSDIKVIDINMISADEDYIEDTFIQNLTFNIKTNGRTSN